MALNETIIIDQFNLVQVIPTLFVRVVSKGSSSARATELEFTTSLARANIFSSSTRGGSLLLNTDDSGRSNWLQATNKFVHLLFKRVFEHNAQDQKCFGNLFSTTFTCNGVVSNEPSSTCPKILFWAPHKIMDLKFLNGRPGNKLA